MNSFSAMAAAAVGIAVGATVVYAATQEPRKMRRNVHKMAHCAEKAIHDLDHVVCHCLH